ncbi:MAG TPA: PspA/IM30 family protein [Actinomycetota bacterium]|nr:PspA/IM30 family protein [Actinomycetota bacterium]
MGAFSRLMTIIKMKFSRAVGRAEDPRELLDYSYERQLDLLQKVRKGIADVATSRARLRLQAGRLEEQVAKLDNQARRAVGAGREDLAKLALQRKKEIQAQLQGMDEQIANIEAEEERLKATEQKLQARIEAFRTRKETTKAQYTAAEAQVKVGEALSGLSEEFGDVGRALGRAEQKTEELQARAVAMDELLSSGAIPDLSAPRDQIEAELQKVTHESEIELELAEMRRELGSAEGSEGDG